MYPRQVEAAEGAEPAEETEEEDPNFHRSSNGMSAISTHKMERHYENSSTAGKLTAMPMMSVLTWMETYTTNRSIGKQESTNDMREGKINTMKEKWQPGKIVNVNGSHNYLEASKITGPH